MLRAFVYCASLAVLTLSAFGCLASGGQLVAPIEITAKIVLEDGSRLTVSPLVSLRVSGFMDSCDRQESFLDGTIRLHVPPIFYGGERQMGCHITVMLPGYRPFTGFVEDGTQITLHRLGPNESSAISTVSLSVPTDARKQYECGENAVAKRKWAQAEERFRSALSIYPKYAMAWSELGQALQEQGRLNEAVEAFNKAREADPPYIKPIIQLAAICSLQQRWAAEMQLSEEAIHMHPVDFPAAYYYHAEAVYHLGKIEDAERFTREAIGLDPGGICPESMVLLGVIFEKQGNPHDALVEYRAYLKFVPHGPQAQQAKEAIARLK